MAEVGSVKGGPAGLCEDARLRLAEDVHYVRLDDQVIVADMRSGRYLGLDGVGARLWELIGEQMGPEAILERLHAEYEVSMDVLRRDVGELLQDLLRRHLVEQEPNIVSPAMSRT